MGIEERIDNWFRGISGDIEIGESDLDDLEKYLQKELDNAGKLLDTSPAEAYGRVVRLAHATGTMARKKPFIVDLLDKYVQKFVDIMNRVKKALGAVSFTITVSFPFDISLSLTF